MGGRQRTLPNLKGDADRNYRPLSRATDRVARETGYGEDRSAADRRLRQAKHHYRHRGKRSIKAQPDLEQRPKRLGRVGECHGFRRCNRGGKMADLNQILERLIQRTADGRVKWNRTVESNQFVASVDTISVVVQETPGNFLFTRGYRLEILNESGDTVEVLGNNRASGETDANSEQSQRLARLYASARRSALDVDATLDKLSKALDL